MIDQCVELTDAERIDLLPLAIVHLAQSYNWAQASPWVTRVGIDLYANERPALLADILSRRTDGATEQATVNADGPVNNGDRR